MPKQVLLGGVSGLPQLYDGVAYAGNSSARTISTSFSPDLVIAKRRTAAGSPSWFDSVRGDYLRLESDGTLQEYASNTNTIAFETDGFSIGGASTSLNNTGDNYMAWCFKAGGTAVTNTDGAITSSVSANPSAGFSVLTYTGNDSTGTIGHGLNSTPELVIVKNRNFSSGTPWYVGAPLLGTSGYLWLNDNMGKATYSDGSGGAFFNYSGWSNSVVNVYDAGSTAVNSSSYNYVMYAFHSVDGVSKIGTYTGNGSLTGPVITTGFQPKFIFVKCISANSNWQILDSDRSPSNPVNDALFFDQNSQELGLSSYNVDFNSDGFAIKSALGNMNNNGSTYLYVAFA